MSNSPPEKEDFLAVPGKRYEGHDIAAGLGESLEQISISPRIAGAMNSASAISVMMDSVV